MPENDPFEGEKVKFPVSFDIKIIMNSIGDDSVNEKILRGIFDRFSILHRDWQKKMSSGNKFVSFSVNITLESQEKMDSLYNELKQEPNIRFAI